MTVPRAPRNPFWALLIAAAAAFCIAVIAYVAAGFGDRAHPLNQLFNRHGAAITTGLAILTVLFGGLALTVDRLQTLRQIQSRADTREGEAPAEPRGR